MTRPPRCPLLRPWYRVAQADGRVLIESGVECVVLEGRAATRFVPALLPLLDGTRTVPELAERLELVDATPVERALALLDEHGLLSEGPPLRDEPAPFAHAAHLAAALRGREATPGDELRRLQEARVAVLGTGPVAGEIAGLLLGSGVGNVARPAWEAAPQARADLVVAAPAARELRRLERWNEAALSAGIEWVQVLPWDGAIAVVGPAFVPGETCCRECYRRRRRSHLEYGDELVALEPVPPAGPLPPALVAITGGLAVALALRRLAGDPVVAGAAAVLELGGAPRLALHPVLRVPRCPACSEPARRALPAPWAEAS